ncbi:MAG: ATP-binding protein [Nitrospirota bacterium]
MPHLRLLIVEDRPSDAELIVRELKNNGYELTWQRVDTLREFESRLAEDPPDVIICDHAMPQFSSEEALQHVRKSGLDVPFIIVSHAIGEEEAVGLLRNGATDYLMKDRLGRLGEAVRQALERQQLEKAHAKTQQTVITLNADLERRIAERTSELQAANKNLELELEQRKRAEDALYRLNDELEQRVEARTRDVVASHHRLRALASELTLTEQRERKRLAGELHDYLAQMLALGRIKLGQLRQMLDATPIAMPLTGEIEGVFDKALTYTRSLMAKLAPPILDELGLPAALTWLAEQMPLHDLAVDVRLESDHVRVPDDQAILLFQSVRELLINVAKHAGTDRATVTLRIVDYNRLCIEVQDSGRGFDTRAVETQSAGEHFGLLCVRERMEAMNGWLRVKSAVGQGTTVTLSLSLDSAADGHQHAVNERD